MVFSSPLFIFYFLPIFLITYFLTPNKFKNFTCLLFSIFFYAWGAPKILPLLLFSCLLDFLISKKLKNKTILILGISYNVASLIYFKYANFFISELNSLAGKDLIQWQEIALPIGISFFTFHKISYLIDVYRKVKKPEKSLIDYLLYILLFPQLVAGPIIRYHDVFEYLKNRKHTLENLSEGLCRFCFGFSKKILIADEVGFIANKIFALSATELNTTSAWLGLLAYTIQIYFDFSAYSDMAIGLARMIGFRFLENFNQPYLSLSITEFWQRWHISLSRFMKDYLYIPLGGNRISPTRTYVNLWIVFIISGFWHGAQWTFLLWGCFHGLMLVIERAYKFPFSLPRLVKHIFTFLLIMYSWLLFRSESFEQIIIFSKVLAFINTESPEILWGHILSNRQITSLIVGIFLSFIPFSPVKNKFKYIIAFILFVTSCCSMMNSNFSPFLYFRF